MSKIEEITVKIDASREVLSTLPKNNQKNLNAYSGKIEELTEEHKLLEEKLLAEMRERVSKFNNLKEDGEIEGLEKDSKDIERILYLTNYIKTSYEKMGFDKSIHNLRYYYQKNLKVVNETILYCIKKFKEVGINLRLDDFCYSKYVREYLTSFFAGTDDIDLQRIQNKFEELYWKCPNIITHIELNIRYLYLKHEKTIDKYYARLQAELLRKSHSR